MRFLVKKCIKDKKVFKYWSFNIESILKENMVLLTPPSKKKKKRERKK